MLSVPHREGARRKGQGQGRRYGSMPAACGGHLDVVKFLIDKGADVKAKDNTGRTALTYAALRGNLDVVKFLIEKGLDVKARDKVGRTVLDECCQGRQLGCCQVPHR